MRTFIYVNVALKSETFKWQVKSIMCSGNMWAALCVTGGGGMGLCVSLFLSTSHLTEPSVCYSL